MQSIELVSFRLFPGTDRAAFLDNARRTEAVVRRQPGFLARMLVESSDGIWSDIVTWSSHAAAMTAAESVLSDSDFAPFGAMIDPSSVAMSHSTLAWRMS